MLVGAFGSHLFAPCRLLFDISVFTARSCSRRRRQRAGAASAATCNSLKSEFRIFLIRSDNFITFIEGKKKPLPQCDQGPPPSQTALASSCMEDGCLSPLDWTRRPLLEPRVSGEQTVFAKFTAAHSALLHRRRRRAAAPLKENGAAAYAETSRLC